MSINYAAYVVEDRRLVLLRLLDEAHGSANESVLHTGLQMLGHRRGVTRQVVTEDLGWLRDRHLVAVEYFADKIMVATLTTRGRNVARGDEVVEGVKRPDP